MFLAQLWGTATEDGRVALRADPAHKRINPVLYRLEESKACWRAVRAPVLWIEGEASQNAGALRLSASDRDQRKTLFANLVDRIIPESGHMLHHDQPEAVAAIVEDFLQR